MQIRVCKHVAADPTSSVGMLDLRPFARVGAGELIRLSCCDACFRLAEAFVLVTLAAAPKSNTPPPRTSTFPSEPPTTKDKGSR